MRAIWTMVLAAVVAGCAGPGGRDDDAQTRRAERLAEEQREQDRLCRIYDAQGRSDPRCPQDPRERERRRDPTLPPLPEPPALPPTQ